MIMPEVEVLRSSSVVAVLTDLTAAVSVIERGRGIRLTASRQIAPTTARRTLRRLAARRIVHHHPARAHEVACGALDVEVVHDLGPRVRRDADDGRGARAGRDGVAREELGGADPAAARCAERLVERDVLGVAAEVEPLARDDPEGVAVGGGEEMFPTVSGAPRESAAPRHDLD